MKRAGCAVLGLALLLTCAEIAGADDSFKAMVHKDGEVKVGDVTSTTPLRVPFIFWGGDMATFYANGGLKTTPDSIFGQQGLNLELVAGDDLVQQARDYVAGKSPFLRGTFGMVGMASEVIGASKNTEGVVFLQMTWSAGDHMVGRPPLTSMDGLKGYLDKCKRKPRIVLQQGGPHVSLLDEFLRDLRMSWKDVDVVWAKDITGTKESPDNNPAALFRKDSTLDACFVVTPDMIALTGGLDKTGESDAEGKVKGARVVNSTAYRRRSIADVYVCRKDFFEKNRDLVGKFVNGYLRACEKLEELSAKFDAKQQTPAEYVKLLTLTQTIYSKDAIPTLDDAHGLLMDCVMVGYPGNHAFFKVAGNVTGFDSFAKNCQELAVTRGYVQERRGLTSGWALLAKDALRQGLAKTNEPDKVKPVVESVKWEPENILVRFDVLFDINQNVFPPARYAADYQNVLDGLRQYGRAGIVIVGHADPTMILRLVKEAGQAKGVLERKGSGAAEQLLFKGSPLNLEDTSRIVELINAKEFDGVPGVNPRETLALAQELSLKRAQSVRESILEFLKGKGIEIDKEKIDTRGMGIAEPRVPAPANGEQTQRNRRVEFQILRATGETTGFEY